MTVAGVQTRYRGPGAADWLVALSSTVLIALEIQTRESLQLVQSGTSYYFDSKWVPQIHQAALVVDGLILLLAAAWLVSPVKRLAERGMLVVAGLGVLLCWGEIVYATKLQAGAVYVLTQMPYRPVNNIGVVGAQVFASYLLLKAPLSKAPGWRAVVVKLALAVGFWFFQSVLWQVVGGR